MLGHGPLRHVRPIKLSKAHAGASRGHNRAVVAHRVEGAYTLTQARGRRGLGGRPCGHGEGFQQHSAVFAIGAAGVWQQEAPAHRGWALPLQWRSVACDRATP